MDNFLLKGKLFTGWYSAKIFIVVDPYTGKMMKFVCIVLALVAGAYSTDLSPAGPSYPAAYGE